MYAFTIVCILHHPKKRLKSSRPPTFTPLQLLDFFIQLMPRQALLQLSALQSQPFYRRLFCPLVTLWYLLFQRLDCDHTLDAVVADARSGGADRLNPKLSSGLRSSSTASYCNARQRLPWQFLLQALVLQASNLLALSPSRSLWHGLQLALLDGSTVRLRPFGDIAQQFRPNGNGGRRPYWCLMRVTVCFCALTGAALDCVMGSFRVSEQIQACQIILRSTARSLFIGDRNFGIFRVAQAARHAGQHVLLRMTSSRARKLLGGRKLVAGDQAVVWKATCRDQLEADCSKEPLAGRLVVARVQRPGWRPIELCLFTTLPSRSEFCPQALVEVYGRRWHIELNLRHLKDQMNMVQLEVKSADMARKEWLAGLLAYNLIRGAQLCGALHTKITPLSLSFSAVRRRLERWLCRMAQSGDQPIDLWTKLLEDIGRCTLPRRRKVRPSEPRAQRYVRHPYSPLVGSRAAARKRIKKSQLKS